jgi:hypothetical protein
MPTETARCSLTPRFISSPTRFLVVRHCFQEERHPLLAEGFLIMRPPGISGIAHPNAAAESLILFDGIVIEQTDPKVVHPALKIGSDFLVPVLHGDAPAPARQALEFVLEVRERLRTGYL